MISFDCPKQDGASDNTFSVVPYLLLISLIPGAIAYYLPGLHKGAEHFIYFAAVLFVCMMLVESLMMILASIVPSFLMAIITDAGIQGLMILTGGFFQLRNDMPNLRAHNFLMGMAASHPRGSTGHLCEPPPSQGTGSHPQTPNTV
jgi:hypothetical protein